MVVAAIKRILNKEAFLYGAKCFPILIVVGIHSAGDRNFVNSLRGGSRTVATSKMERFVIIVNGFQPLTIITKQSILDVAVVLDPPVSLLEMRNVIM